MDTDRYIKEWLDGTLGKEEKEKFEKTETFKEIKKISDATKSFGPPEYNVESELNRFNQFKSGKGKTVTINWQKTILRVAAMLTIVIGGYFYITYFWPVSIETTSAEKSTIFLPDSSEVILNASTEVSYNKKRWRNYRKVELNGEAFFKVNKGSKFEVETSAGTVTILGTQFNVKHRKDFFEVVCYEGQVSVNSEIGYGELTAYHSFRIINGKVIKEQFRNKIEPSWINNESSFTSIPFRHVIGEFERQFNVKVTTKDLDMNKLFTGRFTHDNMVLALKSITIPHNISYKIKGEKHIILTGDIK